MTRVAYPRVPWSRRKKHWEVYGFTSKDGTHHVFVKHTPSGEGYWGNSQVDMDYAVVLAYGRFQLKNPELCYEMPDSYLKLVEIMEVIP